MEVGIQSASGTFIPHAGVLRGDDDALELVSGDGREVVVGDLLHGVSVLLWTFPTRGTMSRLTIGI